MGITDWLRKQETRTAPEAMGGLAGIIQDCGVPATHGACVRRLSAWCAKEGNLERFATAVSDGQLLDVLWVGRAASLRRSRVAFWVIVVQAALGILIWIAMPT